MRKSMKQLGRGHGQNFRTHDSPDRSASQQRTRKSFSVKKNVNFDPRQYMVAQCSLRDIEIYKQVFDFLDDDHDGQLTPLDLRKNIREYGYKPGRAFVYVAMSVFDADNGGQISFKQFVKVMTQRPYENDTQQDVERIFEYIDEDNKGFISPQDLMACAEELREDLTLEEAKQMIRYCDSEGQGVIGKDAFLKFNKRKNFE